MKNAMNYRGYYGSVEFSDEDNVFFGRIIGINDRITFEGDNVNVLRNDFQDAVDEYLETCMRLGKEPEKTYKGSFNVRIDPTLHRRLACFSATQGKTLNATVEEAIQSYIE
jgi:predicted HicB family RNase H-like nuclease